MSLLKVQLERKWLVRTSKTGSETSIATLQSCSCCTYANFALNAEIEYQRFAESSLVTPFFSGVEFIIPSLSSGRHMWRISPYFQGISWDKSQLLHRQVLSCYALKHSVIKYFVDSFKPSVSRFQTMFNNIFNNIIPTSRLIIMFNVSEQSG